MRWVVVAAVGLLVAPLAAFGVVVGGAALLSEWFGAELNPFDFSGIGVLDWLAGGPGATENSWENYVRFMIAGLAVEISYLAVAGTWAWASRKPSGASR